MSVFDDLKDSVSGKSNKKSSTQSRRSKKGSNSGSPSKFGGETDFSNELNSNSNQSNSPFDKNKGQKGSREYPNPQAGRPQKGSQSPQLSSNTQKKMENAGLNPNQQSRGNQNRQARSKSSTRGQNVTQNTGQSRGRGGKEFGNGDTLSVSESRSDFEDLKAQNQQIIELLKRINQNLQGR